MRILGIVSWLVWIFLESLAFRLYGWGGSFLLLCSAISIAIIVGKELPKK